MFDKLKIKLMLKLFPLKVLYVNTIDSLVKWKPLILSIIGIALCLYAMFSISFIVFMIGLIMIFHNWKEC